MGLFDKLFNKKNTTAQEVTQETYPKNEWELPPVIEKYHTLLESTMKESCEITFTLEETKPWESKLGGCPYLEKIEDYPIGRTERPMMFGDSGNCTFLISADDLKKRDFSKVEYDWQCC